VATLSLAPSLKKQVRVEEVRFVSDYVESIILHYPVLFQ